MKRHIVDMMDSICWRLSSSVHWLGLSLLLLAVAGGVQGQTNNPNGPLRIEVIAAPNFVVDSNIQTPAGRSPRSAFIGAVFHNDGTNDLTNVVVRIGNYANGTNSVPGIYPSRGDGVLVGPLPGGKFSLVHEGGSAGLADATRLIGRLKAGESITVYWLISYPLMDVNRVPVFRSGSDPSDDLWLTYDIWGTALFNNTAITAAQSTRCTMRNEISAMANKIYPNTANQVPIEYQEMLQQYAPSWTNIAANGSVGTKILAEGIWYMLGNVGSGYDSDGDLVYDRDAWLQPVGDPSGFDAGYFRLVQTHTLLVVKRKDGGDLVITDEDRLYFKDLPENTAVVGYVRYDFAVVQPGGSGQLTPYQEAASGVNNEKFNADYGVYLGNPLIGLEAEVTLVKTASSTNAVPGQTIQYSMSFTNSGPLPLGDPETRNGLVIHDRVPAGSLYLGGTATNATTTNAMGTISYTVLFSTNNGVSWQETEPVPASSVTDIQWWLKDSLSTQSAGIASFSVQVANPYLQGPLLVNEAELKIGDNPPFYKTNVTTYIQGNNRLGDLVFLDNGDGGAVLGNGLQGGTEPGLSNVTVKLYYDRNTNGVLDATDLAVGTTRSSTNGAYIFTNLMDGVYLVLVEPTDPGIPTGYTFTTSNRFVIALDPTRSTTSAVSVLTADFGLAPALKLTKMLTSGAPLYEGRPVTYSINVTNVMIGDGLGGGAPVTYTVWASNVVADSGWLTPANGLGAPDGKVSTNLFGSQPSDSLDLTDFRMGTPAGSVTNVQVLVPIQVVTPWRDGDQVGIALLTSTGTEFFRTNFVGSAALQTGTLVFDVSTNRAWQWADFNSNAVSISIIVDKGGGNAGGGHIGIDGAAFRVRSTATVGSITGANTLNPVPLRDAYDTTLLQYVSASPTPSSVATNGTAGLILWNNLGPIYPGGNKLVTVTFKALQPTNNTAVLVTNAASVINAYFANGLPANPDYSQVVTNLQPTGVIGDWIWFDADQDGTQDSNEVGIANAKVVLRPPADVDIGAGVGAAITNTTDRNGYYLFEGIANTGRYVVAVLTNSLPAGAINTYSEMSKTVSPTNLTVVTNLQPASVTGQDNYRSADFGYYWGGATIQGRVWNDLNKSGTSTPDAGEYGFTNVWVTLYSTTNSSVAVASNRTDATGFFSFTGPYTGSYHVVVSTNTGSMAGSQWQQTFDTDGIATSNRVTVTPITGETVYADYSYYQTGPYAIGDTLFYDWNGDGVTNGIDEGIPNIPVALYRDSNTNGLLDVGVDTLLAVTNSDAQGYYVFTNVPPGAFLVEVRQGSAAFPPIVTCTADPYGAKDGLSLVILTNASNYAQDFGYQPLGTASIGDTVWRDLNADTIQSGAAETGISNITVRLSVDLNGDGTYAQLAATNTGSSGLYLFSNLPKGSYRVVVDSTNGLPVDAFGAAYVPTTSTNRSVSLTGTESRLDIDFGFTALGAIGDMVFWDNNANGTQDWNEPGISNVTVNLYRDINWNGRYDTNTDTSVGSRTTGTNGMYVFTNLQPGTYVVVVDRFSPPVTNAMLTAAPLMDGAPITNVAEQATYAQYGVSLQAGLINMSADYGFQPLGVLGKMVWLDSNNNGIREDTEQGIPNVSVVLSNAVGVLTNRTDGDGYYSFGGMADGTYWMRVLTNASPFPAGVTPTYDPDGTNTPSWISSIVVSNGHVVSVDGTVRTNFDLSLDFGYRYAGNNTLSGTVGLDGTFIDGRLGTGPFGVSSDEVAFRGVPLSLYVWRDANSNGERDDSESVLISSTSTDTNGDYAFTGLPQSIGSGTNRYIVSLAAPQQNLLITTAFGSTPALQVSVSSNSLGEVFSAYQVVEISPSVTNVDFAFRLQGAYDFGDLPNSYATQLTDTPDGARHRVPGTPDLFMGTTLNTENNGKPSAAASLDDYDDGVSPVGPWTESNGGRVRVKIGAGAGWLVGFVDFNRNGDFNDAGELVLSQAVSSSGTGVYELPVDVASGSIAASTSSTFYARFRLLPDQPAFPAFAYSGKVDNGEVEDYLWSFGAVGDTVWVDLDRDGTRDPGEPPLANVRVFADLNSNGVWSADEPFGLTGTNGQYGIGGFPAGGQRIVVDTSTLPADLTQTFDPDSTLDSRTDISLAEGGVITNSDFGYDYPDASVTLVKTAGSAADGAIFYATAGSNVVYAYQIINSGDTPLINLSVTDDKLGSVGSVAGPLAPDGTVTLFKTNLSASACVTNIGTVTGTPAHTDGSPIDGVNPVQDTDDAVVLLMAEIRGVVWKEYQGIMDGVKTNDPAYSEVPVTLLAGGTNGVFVAGTTTDVNGAFAFIGVETGRAYTVMFSVPKTTNNLYRFFAMLPSGIVADGTNRVSIGNDAVFSYFNTNDTFAAASIASSQVWYGAVVYVDAGLGTNDSTGTLSTSIDLSLYETEGETFLQLCTVDEVVDDEPIDIFVKYADGTKALLGSVRSRGGSQKYLIRIDPALLKGAGPFTIEVKDESGATHVLSNRTMAEFKAGQFRLSKQGYTLTWNSLPGRLYTVYRCYRLGETWVPVAVNIEATGAVCETVVPSEPGQNQAFYKIVMQGD